MRSFFKGPLLMAALFLSLSISAHAITWFPKEFTCPIDGQKNTFMVVGSYGSYIYSYPSKYQWLFFPRTDSPTFYLCKKCSLATFMWDFDELPKEKLAAIKEQLSDIKVSKSFEKYTEIPVTERLEIMEKVYSVLDKEDSWWEDFYRIKGYHYGKAGDEKKASEARRLSLDLIQKQLKKDTDNDQKKILLYISGAMKHFLNDDEGAIADLNKALTTKLTDKDGDPAEIAAAEKGLNERLKDYIDLINSTDKKPRLFDRSGSDHEH